MIRHKEMGKEKRNKESLMIVMPAEEQEEEVFHDASVDSKCRDGPDI